MIGMIAPPTERNNSAEMAGSAIERNRSAHAHAYTRLEIGPPAPWKRQAVSPTFLLWGTDRRTRPTSRHPPKAVAFRSIATRFATAPDLPHLITDAAKITSTKRSARNASALA
jgi:hypothetical protein